MKNWREDAKVVLMMAGIEDKQVSFLILDT